MIAAKLFGGLGNQMFIYAMTRAMSLRNGVPFTFNIKDGFKRDLLYKRNLELKWFDLDLPEKNKFLMFSFPLGHFFYKISCKLGIHCLQPHYQFLKEELPLHFQKEILQNMKKNIYIDGYWQSPSYFSDFSSVVYDDFTIKVKLPKQTLDEWEYLKSLDRILVFVGVRRYQEAIGKDCPLTVCGARYYNEAMQVMLNKLDNPLFVIFGEQKEWAESNLSPNFEKYYVVKKTGELSAISDLFLMRNCNHAIISNSTYYWWGAWLQVKNQQDHYVIAPDNFINPDTPCREWEVLQVNDSMDIN